MAAEARTIPAEAVAEDVAWLRRFGGFRDASTAALAARIGCTAARLERALQRAAVRDSAGRGAGPAHEPQDRAEDLEVAI